MAKTRSQTNDGASGSGTAPEPTRGVRKPELKPKKVLAKNREVKYLDDKLFQQPQIAEVVWWKAKTRLLGELSGKYRIGPKATIYINMVTFGTAAQANSYKPAARELSCTAKAAKADITGYFNTARPDKAIGPLLILASSWVTPNWKKDQLAHAVALIIDKVNGAYEMEVFDPIPWAIQEPKIISNVRILMNELKVKTIKVYTNHPDHYRVNKCQDESLREIRRIFKTGNIANHRYKIYTKDGATGTFSAMMEEELGDVKY